MRRYLGIALALPLLLTAFAARAEVLPFDLEIGYRWADIKGNEDMYRTQINERSGFLIRAFTMSTDLHGVADHFRIDVSELGAGPAGGLRLEASRAGLYEFRLNYRQTDDFSALPAFANPLLGQGIIPGQHTYDRTRRLVDAELLFLPGQRITPFIGYEMNRYSGPGTTTYALGGDEFRLASNLRDTDNEFRAGAAFNFGKVYGQVLQGWRRARGTDEFTLISGAGAGNNAGPVLGRPVSATTITSTGRTDVDTPFTNVYVTGQFAQRVRVIGNYVRASADGETSDNESTAGTFLSFPLSRFFAGTTENINSRAKNSTWRGGARTEITLYDGFDLLAGFQRDHRDISGTALVNTVLLNSITFGGADPRDLQAAIDANSSIDRDEDVLHAGFAARALGPFSLRGEYRESKQDLTVSPSLEEIVVPGNQSGNFNRRIRTFDTNATFTSHNFTMGAAYRKDKANNPVFRTDFIDRDRIRGRASWHTANNKFRVGATAEETKQSNDQIGTYPSGTGFVNANYDAKIRQYSGDVAVAPIAALTLRASMSQFRSDSTVPFRRPENFNVEISSHTENGKSREGGFTLAVKRANLDASAARFENTGTFPFDIDRLRVRLGFDLVKRTGITAEWTKDKYEETNAAFANYDATRYGLYLHFTP